MKKDNTKQMLFEMMSKIDSTFESEVNELVVTENISIDVKVGDTIMTGRFKNSPTVVKSIGKDDHGMPTINGKKVVTFKKSINEAFPEENPEEYRIMVEKLKASMDNLFAEQHFDVIDTLYRLIVERKRPLAPQVNEIEEKLAKL